MANFAAVQVALYTVLSADPVLKTLSISGLVVQVYDFVPQDTQLPYVQIGTVISEVPIDRYAQPATQQMHQIDVWSHQPGMLEVKTIMDRIDTLLHNQVLPLGGKDILCRRSLCQAVRQPDGETIHGVMRYRIESVV